MSRLLQHITHVKDPIGQSKRLSLNCNDIKQAKEITLGLASQKGSIKIAVCIKSLYMEVFNTQQARNYRHLMI